MKLKDIFALEGEPVFGPDVKYLDFDIAWFEGILELQHHHRELDEKSLAATGRFTASRLVEMCDDSGEDSSRVTKLLLDGKPFALHGDGGERHQTDYLLVTDEAAYLEAQELVRAHLKPQPNTAYDVISEDADCSLQNLFGFYYSEMADAARIRVLETFAEVAPAVLGLEAPERHPGYIFLRMSQAVSGLSRDDRENLALIGYAGSDIPAGYLSYGTKVLKQVGRFEGTELGILKASFPKNLSWWTYGVSDRPDATEVIVRV